MDMNFVLVFLCLLSLSNAVVFHPRTVKYIKDVLLEYEKKQGENWPGLVPPPLQPIVDEDLVEFLPHLIIWNPYLSFQDLFPAGSIACPSCSSPTSFSYWNDGSANHLQPRVIYDTENYVLLVSAVYTCPNRHRLVANDATILKKFPSMVPFVLYSRTGFTVDLISLCNRLIVHGVNFYQLESIILEKHWLSYTKKLAQLNCYRKLKSLHALEDNFLSSHLSHAPSDSMFRKVFLSHFLLHEKVYLQEMVKIPITSSISFDHTFKIAANIGYLRKDGKWVSQYDSMFVVINEAGEIVTWQLTKGTSFDEINQVLEDLKCRPSSEMIKCVYIDDCCKLRKKINTLFGDNVTVKLDLFHATQRISKTLNKRSPLFGQCIQELRLVFRCNGDNDVHRQHNTPKPQIMEKKIEDFAQKWTGVTDTNGYSVFTSNTVHAINILKKHIRLGCLSDIPPGAGTNRNERFHHHINNLLHTSKSGILLAYALLSVVIHAYNNAIKKHGKLIYKPIETIPFNADNRLILKPIGITPCDRITISISDDCSQWEVDVAGSVMDMDMVIRIYTLCWKKYKIMNCLLSMGLSGMNKEVVHFQPFGNHSEMYSTVSTTITEQLSKHGLKHIQVDGDGNCFFRAVASSMLSNTTEWKENLILAGLDIQTLSVDVTSQAFRNVFVNELTGVNRALYEEFLVLSTVNYDDEVEKLARSGFYDSDLGDMMPLALCTALKFSMVIYPTDSRMKPIFVTPETVLNDKVVILVHTTPDRELIKGHYDYALPIFKVQPQTLEECMVPDKTSHTISCRCGVNTLNKKNKESSWSCKPSPFYSSRCKCYKNSQSCTVLCKCRICSNPFGCKPTCEEGKNVRKKRKHSLQVSIPDSKRFAESRNETVSEGFWSEFETLVLQEVVSDIKSDEETTKLMKVYNDIVYFAKSSFCSTPLPTGLVLREKSFAQILSKIMFMKTHHVPI